MTALPDCESWMDSALCAETDPALFTVEKGGSWEPARKICGGCDVREACLEYAQRTMQMQSIWGGLSPLERRRLRKEAA